MSFAYCLLYSFVKCHSKLRMHSMIFLGLNNEHINSIAFGLLHPIHELFILARLCNTADYHIDFSYLLAKPKWFLVSNTADSCANKWGAFMCQQSLDLYSLTYILYMRLACICCMYVVVPSLSYFCLALSVFIPTTLLLNARIFRTRSLCMYHRRICVCDGAVRAWMYVSEWFYFLQKPTELNYFNTSDI